VIDGALLKIENQWVARVRAHRETVIIEIGF